ncbi:caspase family protein [Haliscomenobacter hydrossis]|uniref:Peptidase C14 caspase catalytic subunit p20 n=1 Tax=Haliscomenobacter hydrossis (strain ATCC 27775 / DSM 1100 / LMG 10767 / O) TaxID=760192 RepID=F4KRX0_HALH1|nr:caspase family protein [Haliscomenobacter hydrossis]AEE51057.1 peptidase C14 caspase catalytic subunit p20 [Haliscomenobacter hydrossis DSM 1100]
MPSNTDVFLTLNTPMHTAKIGRISVDQGGRYLLTASNDKTAKLWDLGSGNLLRTLRPPIRAGDEGMLYAAALSPDGRVAAVGGWSKNNDIYLFDVSSGELFLCLSDLPNVILDLQFSPDGHYLAVVLWGSNGIKIWRCSDWTLHVEDKNYGGDAYKLAFDAWGQRLATVCYDGHLRLYDATGKLLKKVKTTGGSKPNALAFSPDARLLAIGYNDSPKVQVLDAQTLQVLYAPDISGATSIDQRLMSVTFSANGHSLAAGGFYRLFQNGRWQQQIRVWTQAGRGNYTDYAAAATTIMDLHALPSGTFVFSGYQPEWGIIDPAAGQRQFQLMAEAYDFRYGPDKSHFRLGANGAALGFTPLNQSPRQFQIPTRKMHLGASHDPVAQADAFGLQLRDWYDMPQPQLNGQTLKFLKQYEKSQSVDIASGGQGFVLGADWTLYCADAQGQLRWQQPLQAAAWCVKIDAYKQVVAAACGDGCIRYYRFRDGQPLLTIFLHPDDQRWVLWTPSGYYDASPGAEEFLGWHVNQGPDKAAEYYPLSRFRDTYHRPDVIDLILETLDEAEALKQANQATQRQRSTLPITSQLPPSVRIHSPRDGAETDREQILLEYNVHSPNGEAITGIRIAVDGRPVSVERSIKPVGERLTSQVPIPAGASTVSVIAENRHGAGVAATVQVLRRKVEPIASTVDIRPKLYVLAIGVSAYQHAGVNQLAFAAKDAEDFTACLRRQQNLLYRSVEVKLLTEAAADKDNILDGLDWLVQQTDSRDVAMLYFAGHGIQDNQGNFYYLPVNADPGALRRSALSQGDVQATIRSVAGKIAVFMDACHSGSLMHPLTARSLPPDIAAVVNELCAAENGAVVFSSATSREYALEDARWQNGAFTKALVEGLSGKAQTNEQGKITVKSLDVYVSERVKELTSGKQHPATVYPPNVPDFPVALRG